MKTSKRIKARQYEPIQGRKTESGAWIFDSESHDRVTYMVTRKGSVYKCGCPTEGLCKHITSVVIEQASGKWGLVQLWTDEADARRQHRKMVEMTVSYFERRTRTRQEKPFWVTLARKIAQIIKPEPAPEPPKAPRSAVVEFLWDRMEPPSDTDMWLVPVSDVWVNGRLARKPLDEILDTPGWVHSPMVMVKGNNRPGWHRYRVNMTEVV